MKKEKDNDNLIDYTAYKMRNLANQLARQGRLSDAEAVQYALDSYLLGAARIRFINGVLFCNV